MPGLTSTQKSAVTQFINFTATDKKVAERMLKTSNWNVQQAVNSFFAGGAPTQTPANAALHSALNKTFDKYRDSPRDAPDTISINGAMAYFKDLSIELDHVSVLIIFQLLGCPSVGEFTREGFVDGWTPHNAATPAQQKAVMATLTDQLGTPAARAQRDSLFPKVYKHTFAVAVQPPKRALDLEDAITYWRLLFTAPGMEWTGADGKTPWLEWWVEFLESRWRKAINKDVWDQTRVFAEKCLADASLDWWSEESSWPSVVDEFVGYVREDKWGGLGIKGKVDEGEAMDVE